MKNQNSKSQILFTSAILPGVIGGRLSDEMPYFEALVQKYPGLTVTLILVLLLIIFLLFGKK